MDKLKVCVIGLGHIGNLHSDIYLRCPQAELVGVCDINRDRADAAGARLGVPRFYDAETMLREAKPDLCSIATGGYEYGSDHCEPTLQAIAAGCHIFGEKPISNEIESARTMVRKAREQGVCYGIDFNHRFTPAARKAEEWIAEGKIGDLLFVNVNMWIGKQTESSPYYHLKALHPHTVDLMRHFVGDIEYVQCFGCKAPGRSIWSTAHFSMKFANGAVGGLTGSYDIKRGHPMERCEVAGTEGRFVIEDMWREVTLYPADSWDKTVYSNPVFGGYRGFDDTFACRINTFVEQVASGCAPEEIDGTGLDGLRAQEVIAAAIASIETGDVVKVDYGEV